MKILHVLSQTELTGAETYTRVLSSQQILNGHQVFVVSDRLHIPFMAHTYFQPISKRSYLQRLKNIKYLKSFIKQHQIDVVHAHSRAASWVCYWATRGSRTAYLSSIHGRQHLHLSLKVFDVYGDAVIAISENIKRHLIKEVGMKSQKINVIPNGFEIDCIERSQYVEAFPIKLALLGRTSGPKGEISAYLLKNIFPRLLEKYSNVHLSFAGGSLANFSESTQDSIKQLKAQYPGRTLVRERVTKDEIYEIMSSSSMIIGSGRIAIEALLRNRPVVALGEASTHGLITYENLEVAIESNFGDILVDKIQAVDYSLVERAIECFIQSPSGLEISILQAIKAKFSIHQVANKVEQLYVDCLYRRRLPKKLPVLMYHKILDHEYSSPHKTYLSVRSFDRHLRTLKFFGYSTVGFQDIQQSVFMDRPLPHRPIILTFDDGYRSTLKNAIPILKSYDFKGIFYVLGNPKISLNTWDPVDEESGLANTDEILGLVQEGMEIGAHTATHPHLNLLSDDEVYREVHGSKAFLEVLCGMPLISFAYPFGSISASAKNVVRDVGFHFAVATDSGTHRLGDDRYQVFRAAIFPQDGPLQVLKKALPFYRDYYRIKRRR